MVRGLWFEPLYKAQPKPMFFTAYTVVARDLSAVTTFDVTKEHPAITLVTMVGPSPDWFLGCDAFPLLQNGVWIDSVTIPLVVWDAGTDGGDNFASFNEDLNPHPGLAPRLLSALLDHSKSKAPQVAVFAERSEDSSSRRHE